MMPKKTAAQPTPTLDQTNSPSEQQLIISERLNGQVTMYSSEVGQTDDTPFITANGDTVGQGGGNSFYWDGTSSATDNGGTIIKPTFVSGAGRWLAVDDKRVSLAQSGAVAGIDSTPAIIACFTHANSLVRNGLVSTIKNALHNRHRLRG